MMSTVAPGGRNWPTNARKGGSSGGATAPPAEVLPKTTNSSQVGMMAHWSVKTISVEQVSAATAISVPSAYHSTGNGPGRALIRGSATSASTSPPATASTAISA